MPYGDEDTLRRIVEDEVRRLLAQQQPPTPKAEQRETLVVLCSGTLYGLSELHPRLDSLREHFSLFLTVDEEFIHLKPVDEIKTLIKADRILTPTEEPEALVALSKSPVLLIPFLGRTVAAKMALGITDCLGSRLLFQALVQKKPVLAIREGALEEDRDQQLSMLRPFPGSLTNLMVEYLRRLQNWGVNFVSIHDLPEIVWRTAHPPPREEHPVSAGERPARTREIITRDDLIALKALGRSSIELPADAIITDEARDFALEQEIEITIKD